MSHVLSLVCSYVTTSAYWSAWRALTLESRMSPRILLSTAMLAGSRTLGMPAALADVEHSGDVVVPEGP